MAFSYACLTLQRVVLPVVLALAALFRPVGISFVYLLMFFISPFIPVATTRNFKGSITAYLIILVALSTILLLCHIVLQITIISISMEDTLFASCGFTVQLLRHVGFIDFRNLNVLAIIEWLAPEVVVFVTSMSVYLIIKKLTTINQPSQLEDGLNVQQQNNSELPAQPADTAASVANEVVESIIVEATTPTSRNPKKASRKKDGKNANAALGNHPDFDGLIKISPKDIVNEVVESLIKEASKPNSKIAKKEKIPQNSDIKKRRSSVAVVYYSHIIVRSIPPLFCLATLFFAAVLRPSVPGGFYFLIFLLSGSYWASFQTLKRGFALLLRFVMVILVIHIISIVAYQTPWMQNYASSDLLVSRLISLEPLVTSSCDIDIRIIIYNSTYKLDSFLSPIVMLFSYYALALTTKNLIKPRIATKPNTAFGQQLENGSNKFNRQLSMITHTTRGSKKESWTKSQRLNVSIRREPRSIMLTIEPTETTPLVRHNTRKQRTISTADSVAGVSNTSAGDIQLNSLEERQDEDSGIFDQVSYGIISVGGFIYQNSYIFTNILMMAWSIVYHSWLTFVLLLWANVLWMIPNQRKAMMRSSPFIVIYAELLLLAQYIYGMNLTDDELPATVNTTGVNLRQIGLERPQEWGVQPCVPLIVKTSFLLMFWVTLRQFFKEKSDRRESAASDTFAPLQLGGVAQPSVEKKTSKFLKKFGDIIKNLLVRLWIWLLVLVIFLCAITGKQMTFFRITYMALFLFFLLVFQSSSKAWIKIMYGFWLFLIFEAMSILILIYTYQFDKFDNYWNYYLNVSDTLQKDIGLERYKTKDLFLHLVSPTIIVILTVIQVHYFHNRLIASLQKPTLSKDASSSQTSLQKTRKELKKAVSGEDVEQLPALDTVKDLMRVFFKKLLSKSKRFLSDSKDIAWRLLELHLIKAVYIAAFVCCISKICLLHVIFVAVCLLGAISNKSLQIFLSRIMSIIVSIIILTKMMYQVAYLDHNNYNVQCNYTANYTTNENTAVWFGLDKASEENGGLMGLLRKYICYMVIVTMLAVVTLRQTQMRIITGQQTNVTPKVLFPNISRKDAEQNLRGMLKYLLNYGYYKFGFELSLIMLVATITYRQDIIAVVYAFWLLVLLILQRSKCAKIWFIFQIFIAVCIFVQYVVLVSLPPSLCLYYPWDHSPYSESIQLWAMLPGNLLYIPSQTVRSTHAMKLIFDFILLLMVNRQKRVFHIESQNIPNYAGGSNKSVVEDIANLGQTEFINPTRDFLSHIRNYLDIFMNAVLCGFYWITLGVVFLAGTNIGDLLALGYLIGAFVFLWQGSDFYLRPINVIIKGWNWLIIYNVANILVKTCLQLMGCLFMKQLTENCCWLVHVLGINCVSRTRLNMPVDEVIVQSECPEIASQVVLVWDSVCFAFLLFQLRIFKSHYFCHIINDTKANTILASRGAEIIENLRQKQIEHRVEHEKDVLLKIKRKMEKIRATQQKMLRPIDKPTHFDEDYAEDADEVVRMAPLAHNSSFSSCQGSGYHTPDDEDDDDDTTTTGPNSSDASVKSSSSNSSGQEQLLGRAESENGIDDLASDAQTDYADVRSLSDAEESAAAASIVAAIVTPPILKRRPPPSPLLLSPADANIQLVLQPNTPSTSELLTLPLDGFLEANRLSGSSAPNSDLAPNLPDDNDDDDDDVEVFSPPPYEYAPPMHSLLPPTNAAPTTSSLNVNVSRGSSVISSSLAVAANGGSLRCRRQSSLNAAAAVSWSETISVKHAPHNANEDPNVSEDVPVTLRQKSLHRRHLSMGNASYSMDETTNIRRRYSNISWARDEAALNSAARPNSWGPVGNAYYMESLIFEVTQATLHAQSYGYPIRDLRPPKRKEIKLHPDAVRAGDYYMFDDMDEKFELDFIEDEVDFLDDKISESERKMTRRKTIIDVWKDIKTADIRRQVYVRQRSYASAPGSSIGIQLDDELNAKSGGGAAGVRTSTISEPIGIARRSTSEYFTKEKVVEIHKEPQPTTSKTKDLRDEPGVSSSHKSDESDRDVTDKADDKEDSDEDIQANPIVRLLEAFLVSLTIRLNRFSRNYRYVNKILAEEKKTLKESRGFHRLGRNGAVALFTFMKGIRSDDDSINSTTSSINALNINKQNETDIQTPHENNYPTTNNEPSQPSQSQSQSQPLEPSLSQPQPPHDPQEHVVDIIEISNDIVDAKSNTSKGGGGEDSEIVLSKGQNSEGMVPEIRVMAPSLDRSFTDSGLMSRQRSYEKVDSLENFNLEDDFASRDHHILVEVMISTWYAILSNTDLICYIVVFINQVVNASIISLPLPFMVFLWGTLSLPRPTKTFWVTLMAYTQAIVLIKCIFQFKLIWANYINLPNQPLSPAKIFGVEMESHHTIYDLLLLLVLFFHRFILKSQGLWKSEYKEEMVQEAFVMHYDKPVTKVENEGDNDDDDDDDEDEGEEDVNLRGKNLRRLSADSVESVEYNKGISRIEQSSYIASVRKFFFNMVKKARLPSDVYALMFLCDFINFFVLLFGFTAFGSQQTEGDGGVQTYLAENKVPIPFLIMLLVQFILIVIDRALYLRKALINKIIFHFFSVIGIHIWMFFIVPMVTERSFYSLAPPIIFYIIKCFYLLLSSYQIKCGYPKRILGNFLTKGFTLVNMISFKFYMLIPFLYELRTILDWVCTDTTMTLFDWLKMEDIFSDIYFIKCSRQMEHDFPAIRAQKKATYIKLLMGGTMILCIVIAIWGPLCLFALGNAVGQSNVPYEVSLKIRIGPYEPIYDLNNRESVHTFDNNMFEQMTDAYKKDKSAITFLSSYDASDIAAVRLPGNSPSMWDITPPDKERLLSDLRGDVKLVARFTYSLTRIPPAKGGLGTVIDEITYTIDKDFEGRNEMIKMLNGSSNAEEVLLPSLLPKFLKVPNTGDMSVPHELVPKTENYRGIILKMNTDGNNIWWEIKESCTDDFYKNTLSKLPYSDCTSGIVIYTFNDKKFPSTFSFLTAGGIIGLYSTFVLIASRLLKSFISGQNRKIMFEDLPYVDRVLQLCLDIYLVREALEFALEEDLFAKLIFLYRSPETMIKWTRPKEETNEDETDTESVRSRHSARRQEQHQQQQQQQHQQQQQQQQQQQL